MPRQKIHRGSVWPDVGMSPRVRTPNVMPRVVASQPCTAFAHLPVEGVWAKDDGRTEFALNASWVLLTVVFLYVCIAWQGGLCVCGTLVTKGMFFFSPSVFKQGAPGLSLMLEPRKTMSAQMCKRTCLQLPWAPAWAAGDCSLFQQLFQEESEWLREKRHQDPL